MFFVKIRNTWHRNAIYRRVVQMSLSAKKTVARYKMFIEGKTLASVNQRTNGPVNAHLISWPSKAQNIQNLENIW